MEIENLTTVDESMHVNDDIQDVNDTPTEVTEEVPAEPSNESTTESDYDTAWDNVDVNDDSIFDRTSATNDEPVPAPAAHGIDPLSTTQDTNNNIGAFMVDKPVLKYRGKDIPIDNEAELIALAQKGFSYETEMSNIKPHKKAISIIDGIPLEVLQAVADIHGGNTDAISYIKKQYGIEDARSAADDGTFWDSSNKPETPKEEPAYAPKVAQENPIEDFWTSYSSANQQGAAKVSDIYSGLDESFKAEVYKPDVFPAFVRSIENGEFDSAYPIAIKEKSLNPAMSWLQAYGVAVKKIGQAPVVQTEPPASATPPKSTAEGRHLGANAAADRVWNDDAYFKQLEDKLFA